MFKDFSNKLSRKVIISNYFTQFNYYKFSNYFKKELNYNLVNKKYLETYKLILLAINQLK